jgi:hypothetical protein
MPEELSVWRKPLKVMVRKLKDLEKNILSTKKTPQKATKFAE